MSRMLEQSLARLPVGSVSDRRFMRCGGNFSATDTDSAETRGFPRFAGGDLPGQLDRGAGDVGLELVHGCGADDVAGEKRPAVDPGQGHLRGVDAVLAGQVDVAAHGAFGEIAGVALEAFVQRQPGTGGLGVVEVLAAERAEGERRVCEQADLFPVREFGEADFERAVQQAVRVLDGVDAGQALRVRQSQVFGHAPGGFVGDADVADLARGHGLVQRGQCLVDWCADMLAGGVAQLAEIVG